MAYWNLIIHTKEEKKALKTISFVAFKASDNKYVKNPNVTTATNYVAAYLQYTCVCVCFTVLTHGRNVQKHKGESFTNILFHDTHL